MISVVSANKFLKTTLSNMLSAKKRFSFLLFDYRNNRGFNKTTLSHIFFLQKPSKLYIKARYLSGLQIHMNIKAFTTKKKSTTIPTMTLVPKRLMFIVSDLPFFLSHRKRLATAAKDAGYNVSIACPPDFAMASLVEEGFTVLPLKMHRGFHSFAAEWRTFCSVWQSIRQFKPDALHLITSKPIIYGGLTARILSIPSLSAISGLGYVFTGQTLRHRIMKFVVTRAYGMSVNRRGSHVLFQNKSDMGLFRAAGLLKRVSVSIIPGSGVDLDQICPEPMPKGELVVLLPSRMLRDKGVLEFVAAARLLHSRGLDVVFRLLGDPDIMNPTSLTRHELEAFEADGSVEWQPHTTDISAALAQAHLVVLPSYREGLPKTLIDAAAAGRAVATSDVPGCRDAIKPGETGELFKVRDASDMADVIAKMLADRIMLEHMGMAARRHAEVTFDIRTVISKHLDIYDDLLIKSGH